MDPRPPIDVILPCHDEGATIAHVVRACRQALGDHPHGILVVDDGSRDDTAVEARAAGAQVLSLSPNRGKGRALQAGVAATARPLLLFLDGDGQDDPADLPRLLAALTPEVDLVIGSRFLGVLHEGSIHPLNRAANLAFSRLISVLFRTRITDSQAGVRLLRRAAWERIAVRAREYDVETEVLLKGLKAGWRVVEVPVSRYPRGGSVTDFKRVRHGSLILWTIVRERFTR
jgi:glycosyltransferase involved in cell wall biosynthesis